MICSCSGLSFNIDQLDIPNKTPFIGLFNHTKTFGPGLIMKMLAGGQKLTLTLKHSVALKKRVHLMSPEEGLQEKTLSTTKRRYSNPGRWSRSLRYKGPSTRGFRHT
jgi:hypothetical protein